MIFPSQHISQVVHTAFSTEESKVRIYFQKKATLEVFPKSETGSDKRVSDFGSDFPKEMSLTS